MKMFVVFRAAGPHGIWYMSRYGAEVSGDDRHFFHSEAEAENAALLFGWRNYEISACLGPSS
jgi:hypothetical protein